MNDTPTLSALAHGHATCVRTAQAADAGTACALLRAAITRTCAADHGHDPVLLAGWLANKTPEHVAGWIGAAANHCIVATAERDGALAGVALVTRKGRIALLHVAPDRLRRGVGSALLAALERQGRAWGLAELRVDGTRSARDFFARHGYRKGAPINTTYGIVAVTLVKRLVPSYARRPACGCERGGRDIDES